MSFEVFDAASPDGLAAWLKAWDAWPGREVQAHPEYAKLFARPCDRVVCAAGQDAGGSVLFPLILRPLSAEPWAAGESRWDAATPYGYGGPYAWGPGPRDDAGFWRAFAGWAARELVVSVFARLSLFPGQIPALPATTAFNAENVVVPVSQGVDALWAAYDKNVRNSVRKAEKDGLTVEFDLAGDRIDDFMAVYADTMKRRNASAFYLFPRSFYEGLFSRLPGRVMLAHAYLGGRVVSSDLILLSQDHAYYFLAGTLEDAYAHKPTYLLKHREISWLASSGKTGFVLGGGYEAGDGIFKFKKAFAPGGVTAFKTLGWTVDEAAARELAGARAAREAAAGRSWSPRPNFFPPYRA